MRKTTKLIVTLGLALTLFIALSSTALASTATYQSNSFTSGWVGSNIATKTSSQRIFDYNQYCTLVSNPSSGINYYLRIVTPTSTSNNVTPLTNYQTNYNGGQNYYSTSATSVKVEINNYYHQGTAIRIKGSFGHTA